MIPKWHTGRFVTTVSSRRRCAQRWVQTACLNWAGLSTSRAGGHFLRDTPAACWNGECKAAGGDGYPLFVCSEVEHRSKACVWGSPNSVHERGSGELPGFIVASWNTAAGGIRYHRRPRHMSDQAAQRVVTASASCVERAVANVQSWHSFRGRSQFLHTRLIPRRRLEPYRVGPFGRGRRQWMGCPARGGTQALPRWLARASRGFPSERALRMGLPGLGPRYSRGRECDHHSLRANVRPCALVRQW